MVEVFKTNIQHKRTAEKIKVELLLLFPNCKINFDLNDCDRILRIESAIEVGEKIEEVLNQKGFYCEELP
ncbi:MAG: hypothetical protein HY015_03875 [Bacteroidetes bacterium]|nr:hypothetical protein [Bacteroidota bacterium]MBI3482102.1 hypothetical protein [Bacteroidota bacterium]